LDSSLALDLLVRERLDAAGKAPYCTINLLPRKGQAAQVCRAYHILGDIHQSNGEREQAVHYFAVALEIAPPSNIACFEKSLTSVADLKS
jgi:hypothetical protein